MDFDAWALVVAIGSLIVAIWAIRYSREQAKSAIEQAISAVRSADAAHLQADSALRQLELSEKVRREQQEPYVVVNIRPSEHVTNVFLLVIENLGPTVARNVRIGCSPPIERVAEQELPGKFILRNSFIFNQGIPIMPPGWKIELFFDMSHKRLNSDLPLQYTFTADTEGPFGPVEQLTYEVDLRMFTEVETLTVKGVHQGVKEMEKLRKAAENISSALRRSL
ncbi:hypothetical protein [Actinomadura sp. 7K534]|uniref:hypothetical protein n=1 Tax=Actinomadura sp. 7K534 TaxID=2530366 RepID=UPI0010434FFB|nr:hypothetical protein [Actinomadura sp. 7K534]TDB95350.1 hypothetical protein E1266_13490 [Actinomadura sp. 7K534]